MHARQGRTGDPAAAEGQRRVAARLDPAAAHLAAVQLQTAGADHYGGQSGVLPGQRDSDDAGPGGGHLQHRPSGVRRQDPYGVLGPVLGQQGHRAVHDQRLDVLARRDPDLVAVGGGAHGGTDAAVGAAAPGGDPVHGGCGGHGSSIPSVRAAG
ncbi:hypothetical protein CTU88_30020 [Streptomyces sp. JV178]|nr:hypothetical protein CTU88_30020 [Streptomyces sp. JV178]